MHALLILVYMTIMIVFGTNMTGAESEYGPFNNYVLEKYSDEHEDKTPIGSFQVDLPFGSKFY